MSKTNELTCIYCGDTFVSDWADGTGEVDREMCRKCEDLEKEVINELRKVKYGTT